MTQSVPEVSQPPQPIFNGSEALFCQLIESATAILVARIAAPVHDDSKAAERADAFLSKLFFRAYTMLNDDKPPSPTPSPTHHHGRADE